MDVDTQETEQVEVETTEAVEGLTVTLEDALNAALDGTEIDEVETEEVVEEEEVETEEATEEAEEEVVGARPEWNDKEQAAFEKMAENDPIGAKILKRRYEGMLSGFHEKSQENAELKKEHVSNEAMNKIFDPFMDDMARSGITKEEVVAKYVAWEKYINNSPAEAIAALAKENGIDLTELAFGGDPEDDTPENASIKKLEAQIQELENKSSNEESVRATEKQNQLVEDAGTFASEIDEKGDLVHPHCNDVVKEMAVLIQQGLSLKDAYDRAVWADPKIRTELLKAQTKVESTTDKKARISKAKKLKSFSSGAGVKTSVKPNNKMKLDDALNAAFAEHN